MASTSQVLLEGQAVGLRLSVLAGEDGRAGALPDALVALCAASKLEALERDHAEGVTLLQQTADTGLGSELLLALARRG